MSTRLNVFVVLVVVHPSVTPYSARVDWTPTWHFHLVVDSPVPVDPVDRPKALPYGVVVAAVLHLLVRDGRLRILKERTPLGPRECRAILGAIEGDMGWDMSFERTRGRGLISLACATGGLSFAYSPPSKSERCSSVAL